MPEALRKRLRLTPEDSLPATEFELTSAPDAMSAFEQICLSIPASGALIAVRDTAGLHSVGSLGDAPEVGSRLPADFGMALECLETGSVVFHDLANEAQRVLCVGMSTEGVSQIRSAVALPMRANNVIVGLIAVFSHRESSIQPRDIKALARIADFWGPLMADEWFPDGIPAAIAGDTPANAAASQFLPVQEKSPVAEAAPLAESPLAAEEFDEVAPQKSTEAAPETHDFEPVVTPVDTPLVESVITPAVSNTKPPLVTEPILPHEDPAPPSESRESPKPSEEVISAETGVIARAAKQHASPVFLAPAEPIPVEALHPGGPQRNTWLIMLAVFLVVLLPFWYLRSHWNHSSTVARNSVSASSNKPANATAANPVSVSPTETPADTSAASAKKPGPANGSENSSPTPKALAPDEEMPKPLPDLNTQPPAENSASSLPAAAKPTLPAIVARILKSPKAILTKPDSNSTEPPAPDFNTASQPPVSTDASRAEESNSPSAAVPTPEPAPPVNPAGLTRPTFILAQTLKAHSGWVSSLAFSSNEKLASGSWDRTVKFWDLATGRELRAVTDKLKQVQAVAFSRDGKFLAVEDASDTVTIFDPETGTRIRELPTDKTVPSVGISWVYSIAFSPDSRWLASAVDDKTVRIWDVRTGQKIRDLTGPRRPIVYTAFSPNGELIATGNDEKSIQLWNVASGAPTSTLSGHKKVINAVAFSPDGKTLASASGDKTIRLWDVATGKHTRTLSGHQAAVSSISFSGDGHWLASGSWDKTVRIWNLSTGKEVQTLRPDARAIYSVTFDPHGRWLAAGSEDGAVEIWQWNGSANP